MIGAIIGDIVGSRFEFDNIKTKKFELFTKKCFATDDSMMTLAIARAILNCRGNADLLGAETVKQMQIWGRAYPFAGYGGMFRNWIFSENPRPYNSFGNGAAMRVSACGFAGTTLDEVKKLAKIVTETTHNHPEGLKGAEATAVAIFLARERHSQTEIRRAMENYYSLDFTLDGIRATYKFNETCQDTVPQALVAFLEATDFEDAIRNVISIGGDSDTLAAITGGIAEAYFGVPADLRERALAFLDKNQRAVLDEFERKFPAGTAKKCEE